ncbi:hypothetical protein Scep_010457 [Stephania cephalantha]|uniref:Uncharacterized protein n=1 Tax=Stephania cephalantha TaxID=152367 RepID=A0AAP0JVG5_9MAGN
MSRPKTQVCLALPRLYDPDPVAPALGGLGLLGHLSIVSFDTHFSLYFHFYSLIFMHSIQLYFYPHDF